MKIQGICEKCNLSEFPIPYCRCNEASSQTSVACTCYCHIAKDGETYTTSGCIHCKGYEIK